MNNLTDKELLNYALENGMIDITHIQMQIEMNERKKYIQMHESRIWQSTDNNWYTYLPDLAAKSGKRLAKRKTKDELENVIVEYYRKQASEPYIQEVFNEWSESKLRYGEIQRQTYDRYKTDFVRFFKGTKISKTRFSYITEDMLEDFIKSTICDKQLTAKAWGGLRLLIVGIFKYAKKKGYTAISITNFMGDLELSRKSFKKRTFTDQESVFTDKEIDLIVEYISDKEPSIINLGILLAFQTGLRIGELSALTWQDINGNLLTVNKTEIRYRGENGKYIYEVREDAKTEAGNRTVIISDTAIKTLRKIRALNPFGEYIFVKNGERIKEKAFSVKIVKICNYVGIPPRSMHKARKTYGTKLLNAGVDERLVINQMGHTNISTTKHFYYFNNKDEAEAKEQIQRALNF